MDIEKVFDANMIELSDIKIKSMCYESYPCQHFISIDNGKTWELLDSIKIVKKLISLGIDVHEHFKKYIQLI